MDVNGHNLLGTTTQCILLMSLYSMADMVHAIINSSNGVSSILLLLPTYHCYYLHQPEVLKS
jgi:hypothetical protein